MTEHHGHPQRRSTVTAESFIGEYCRPFPHTGIGRISEYALPLSLALLDLQRTVLPAASPWQSQLSVTTNSSLAKFRRFVADFRSPAVPLGPLRRARLCKRGDPGPGVPT